MFDQINDFLHQGGPVLYAIMLVCFLLWTLILERLYFFYLALPKLLHQFQNHWQYQAGQLANAGSQVSLWQRKKIQQKLLGEFNIQNQQGLSLIALLIAICPLLGLLGTVTGMIQVFDVMAVTGTGNARAMASGISQATLPTMSGLLVALTGLYFKTRFVRLSERGVQKFNERINDAAL